MVVLTCFSWAPWVTGRSPLYWFRPKSITVTTAAFSPSSVAQLRLVEKKTFEDQQVPLDGYVYRDCTFRNVCLIYDGGAYQLHNATFTKGWSVCARSEPLQNYSSLLFSLDKMEPGVVRVEKTFPPPLSELRSFLGR